MAARVDKEPIADDEDENKLRKDFEARMIPTLEEILEPQKKLIKNMKSHGDSITALQMSRDDTVVVVGCASGRIQILNLNVKIEYYEMVNEFEHAHNDMVTSLQITPNNRYLISGSRDKSMKVFDLKKMREAKVITEHKLGISALALCENKNLLFSAGLDGTIHFFDVKDGFKKLEPMEKVHNGEIRCLVCRKDGEYLISGGKDQNIHIIDRERKEISETWKLAHDSAVTCLALSKDDSYLVSGSADKTINIYSMEQRRLLTKIDLVHEEEILSIGISSDCRFIISGGADNSISFSDLEKGEMIHRFDEIHQGPVTAICCSKKSLMFASGSMDKLSRIWNLNKKFVQAAYTTEHKGEITCVLLNNKKDQLITASADRSIKIIDLKDDYVVHTFADYHSRGIMTIALSNSGRWLFSGSVDRCIHIYDLDKLEWSGKIEDAHLSVIYGIAIAKDDSFFVSVGLDNAIRTYKSVTERTLDYVFPPKPGHTRGICQVCITEDGRYIITAGFERDVKIWDKRKKELFHDFKDVHRSEISALVCTHDSRYILSGSRGLNVYDLFTKKRIYQTRDYHKGMVTSLNISSDNRYMTSSSKDHTLRVYNIENRTTVHEFDEIPERFLSSVNTLDNKIIYGAAENSVIYAFRSPIATGELYVSDPTLSIKSEIIRYMILNRFIVEPEGSKMRILRKYPRLIFYPSGQNWFHLICLYYPEKKLLTEAIHSHVPFIRDSYGKTPLHYLIEADPKNPALINIVLSKFGDILDPEMDNYDMFESFADIFVDLVKTGVPGLKSFLENFTIRARIVEGEEIPLNVNIKGGKSKCITTDKTPILREELYEKVLVESAGDANIISIKYVPTPLDYDPLSLDMSEIVNALLFTDEVDLLRTKVIENLIAYNWNHNKFYHIIYGIFITGYMIAFSIYATGKIPFENANLPMIILIGIYLVNEAVRVIAMGGVRSYLSDVWNYTDIGMIVLHLATFIMIFVFGRGYTENPDIEGSFISDGTSATLAINWLLTFSIFFGYAKWFSYFRIFDTTRRLSRQIIQIVKDLRPFFLVWILVVMGFTIVFMQFDIDGTETSGFGNYLQITYRLTFSDFSISEFVAGQYAFMVVVTIILTLILFNMLVAIMTDSFEKVQETAVISESQELLRLITQAVAVKRLLRKRLCPGRMRKYLLIPKSEKRSFLFVAEEAGVDEAADDNSEWEGRIQVIKKTIKANEDNMKAAIRTTGVAIEKDLDDTRFESNNLELSMRRLENRIARVENAITKYQDSTDIMSAALTDNKSKSPPSSVADKKDLASRLPIKKDVMPTGGN